MPTCLHVRIIYYVVLVPHITDMARQNAGPRKSHTIRMPEELYGLVTAKAAQTGKTINDVCVDALARDTADVGEAPPPKAGTEDEIFTVQVGPDMVKAARDAVGIMDAPAWLRERLRRGIQLERGIVASIDVTAARIATAALPAPENAAADSTPEPPAGDAETPEPAPDMSAGKPKKKRWWRRRRDA